MASDAFLPRPTAQPVLFNQPGPLPPLQSTEARTCYRQRSQDDVEEVRALQHGRCLQHGPQGQSAGTVQLFDCARGVV